MNVVLVHGFADTGRIFNRLSASLSGRGHACHAPTLHPRDARLGIADISRKLEVFIRDTLAPADPFALVGFSMGALVARHFLQSRGGLPGCLAFFSIAGPHLGTASAWLYPGAGTRDMRPGSAFLRGLETGAPALLRLPLFTYRTPLDLMVFSARTTRLPSATEVVAWCPFHSLLPSDPRVMGHIGDELSRLSSATRP